jgi:c-di-GMP-binding flagellar brake protein YcgR
MSSKHRRDVRMSLSLPIKVQGHDRGGASWEEMSTVSDVSPGGTGFPLRHAVHRGQILHLALPLPKRFRRHDLSEVSYRVFALVRRAEPHVSGVSVGVLFLGKLAPRGFEQDPGGIYLLPGDPAPTRGTVHRTERRRHSRLEATVDVRLRRTEPGRADPQEERTFAENIGRGGLRVMTTLAVDRGEILMLEEVDGPFRSRVAVRNAWIGTDNVSRLNLEFLDGEAPDRLVATS